MKKTGEIKEALSSFARVDSHVHTHLCDGMAEMTVENIAQSAKARGVDCVILVPHFHKRVYDENETLYTDTDENIFLALREEISSYEKNDGAVTFFLSTETDILTQDGDISLDISRAAENALDFVMPTFNFHPLLPLDLVKLTYGKYINGLHESGEYENAAKKLGGVSKVLETMYRSEVNALDRCPYPMMLGHFFMAHSIHPDKYSAFGAKKEHLSLMNDGARRVVEACKRNNALIDLTGVHLGNAETVAHRIEINGFFVDFQVYTVCECVRQNVGFFFGSDAHRLEAVGAERGYYDRILDLASNADMQ